MRRLAWFSPMPPDPSGIAGRSAELVAALRPHFDVAVFDARNAHDFLWQYRREPFDLTIYQLGNSSLHDYIWPYLFRFPGLAVLHDAHLHHARASTLLRHQRFAHYRQEFAANHPDASPDLAELAVRGFDNYLYYTWPMTRLVIRASRVTAVHAAPLVADLAATVPEGTVESIRLGEGVPLSDAARHAARRTVRPKHGIADTAVVFGVFGGLTPEKRVHQVLSAFASLVPYQPDARLLLVGAPARHLDVPAEVTSLGIGSHVVLTGYVEEGAFTEYLAATDVSINLRWPTAREMSGPWLRALAAGVPTITTDLSHLVGIPSLDPRTWTVAHTSKTSVAPEPVRVAIDILDEDHSLRLAMRRLASDAALREQLARAGLAYWHAEHTVDRMVHDYRRVIECAVQTPAPAAALPAHLRQTGEQQLSEILDGLGMPKNVWSTI
jgi:glycosyltransferase involved in cell wall biosynthesis